jgi:hypothetical protein
MMSRRYAIQTNEIGARRRRADDREERWADDRKEDGQRRLPKPACAM